MTNERPSASPIDEWAKYRRLAPPRRVRRRSGFWQFCVWTFVLFWLAPLAAAIYQVRSYREFEALRARGAATVGYIEEATRESSRRGRPRTTADVRFQVGGTIYRFQAVRRDWNVRTGGDVEVVYLPDNPDVALVRETRDEPFHVNSFGGWTIVAGVVGAMGILVTGYAVYTGIRNRLLLVRGLPVEATIDGISPPGRGAAAAHFSFSLDGRVFRSKSALGRTDHKRLQVGERVPVIYDPQDPDRSELFSEAITDYEIVDPAGTAGG